MGLSVKVCVCHFDLFNAQSCVTDCMLGLWVGKGVGCSPPGLSSCRAPHACSWSPPQDGYESEPAPPSPFPQLVRVCAFTSLLQSQPLLEQLVHVVHFEGHEIFKVTGM